MTDQPDHLDHLASSHLDGRTTPAEAARISAEPALADRVARLQAARAALRATGDAPVDRQRRDQAIDAALAAFDASFEVAATTPGAGAASPVVVPLAARRGVSRRTLQLVGIAAAAVLVAVAVPLLGRLGDRSGDESATVEEAERDASTNAADDGAGGAAGGESSTALSAMPVPVDLGSFDDVQALAEAVRLRMAPAPGATPEAAADAMTPAGGDRATTCAIDDPTNAATTVYTAVATLTDRSVVVVVRESAGGELSLEALDSTTCTTVASYAL